MITSQTPTDVKRFDFDPSYAQRDFIDVRQVIGVREWPGKTADGQVGFTIRWTINGMDVDTEVYGLLAETSATFVVADPLKDLEELRQFAYNSFMNVEIHFQDNAPPRYRHMTFRHPDFVEIAKSIISKL